MSPARSRTRIHLLLINGLAIVVFGWFLHGRLNEWGGDNVTFLLLAEAVATGEGYVDLHELSHPPHTRYPPLFPLLLAPFVGLGASLYVIKLWVAGLGLAGLNLAYLYLARTRDASVALGVCLCMIVSPVFLDPVLSAMSDGPFLPLTLCALYLVDRALAEDDARPRMAIGAGVFVGLSLLMRAAGVLLIPTAIVVAVLGRSEVRLGSRLSRVAIVLLVAGGVYAPWAIWSNVSRGPANEPVAQEIDLDAEISRLGLGAFREPLSEPEAEMPEPAGVHESYLQLFRQGARGRRSAAKQSVLDRPMHNVRDYELRLYWFKPTTAFYEASPRLAEVVRLTAKGATFLLVALCGLGGAIRLLTRRRVEDVYTAGTIALILIWIGGGPRLLVPILPFLFVWSVDGAGALVGLARRLLGKGPDPAGSNRTVTVVTLSILFAFNAFITFGTERMQNRLSGSPGSWWGAYQEALADVALRSNGQARLISAPANVPYYLHGMPSVEVGWGLNGKLRRDLIKILSSEPDYVVMTPFGRHHSNRHFRRVIDQFVRRFPIVARYGGVTVHEVIPNPRLRTSEPEEG